ncbi:CRISPR-associated endoribonuclease Cas2 [bacterium HR34]|nr:CRISPR-associated endoribonuclease Cas2 [bacterium HR34]
MSKNSLKKIKIGKTEKEILDSIYNFLIKSAKVTALSMLIGLSGYALGYTFMKMIIKDFNSKRGSKKEINSTRLRRSFESLKRKRLIEINEDPKSGEVKICLTDKGVKYALIGNINNLKLDLDQKWDEKWRLIVFDIPDKYKIKRNDFVNKLKELNLYPLQKSVFVCPYNIKDIVDFVSEFYEVSPYVRVIEANYIEGDEEIRKFFNL